MSTKLLQHTPQDADTKNEHFLPGFFCICSRKLVRYLLRP